MTTRDEAMRNPDLRRNVRRLPPAIRGLLWRQDGTLNEPGIRALAAAITSTAVSDRHSQHADRADPLRHAPTRTGQARFGIFAFALGVEFARDHNPVVGAGSALALVGAVMGQVQRSKAMRQASDHPTIRAQNQKAVELSGEVAARRDESRQAFFAAGLANGKDPEKAFRVFEEAVGDHAPRLTEVLGVVTNGVTPGNEGLSRTAFAL
jgi:hypothetical protein